MLQCNSVIRRQAKTQANRRNFEVKNPIPSEPPSFVRCLHHCRNDLVTAHLRRCKNFVRFYKSKVFLCPHPAYCFCLVGRANRLIVAALETNSFDDACG